MKVHLSLLVPLLSLSLFACSDAPPQPPAIGLEAALRPAYPEHNPDGRRCQVQPSGSRSYVIGRANGGGTVEDGKDSVKLSCTVRENGSFSIEVNANNMAPNLTGSFGMNLGGSIRSKTDGTQNTGQLGFRDSYAGLMGPSATTPPCTFSPPSASEPIVQKAGAMVTSFVCPLIVSTDSPGDGCRAEGKIAVEYCKTGEEDE
ncbi:MAG TPA: hypothetical protein VGK73_19775 [Polyangiaceae bacterium]